MIPSPLWGAAERRVRKKAGQLTVPRSRFRVLLTLLTHDQRAARAALQLRRFEALVADNRKLRSLAKKCDKALSALMSAARKAQN